MYVRVKKDGYARQQGGLPRDAEKLAGFSLNRCKPCPPLSADKFAHQAVGHLSAGQGVAGSPWHRVGEARTLYQVGGPRSVDKARPPVMLSNNFPIP